MKPWLSYVFGEPDNGSLPEFNTRRPFDPCYVWWRPEIMCETLSQSSGGFYEELAIPSGSIREVWVESCRAYHLLCRREDMADFEGMVRICEPVPEVGAISSREFGVLALCGDTQEMAIGIHIVSELGGIVGRKLCPVTTELMGRSRVVLIPTKTECTSLFLCAAVSSGSMIVSSDAGSAEEYLSNNAPPGTWHVVHDHKQGVYREACKDLMGIMADVNRSMYIDEAPYE